MPIEPLRNPEPATPDMTRPTGTLGVVAGLFTDRKTLHDAIADLSHAGFGPDQIAVVFSTEENHSKRRSAEAQRPRLPEDLEDHSLVWKFKQSYEHDMHRRGDEQMSGAHLDEHSGDHRGPQYSEVDLWQTLALFGGATEDRVKMMNREMGPEGSLLLVQCAGRAREVEMILEGNTGKIRTETVTDPLLAGRQLLADHA
ncbi:MAG TPA: hypothetical protein VMU62_07090 [Acidobacteriaceae bacterium]|nr:hypothetical protein [Acidobacteriaceae bacterium]